MSEKYLVNGNFKALRSGEFVTASVEDGEFILTQEEAEGFTIATLTEIANANKMTVPRKVKHGDLVTGLMAHLSELKLPKVNKMTDTQIVEEIVDAGVAAGQSEDEMLVEIVNRGVSFKAAGKLWKAVMENKGYAASSKTVAETAATILAGVEDEDGNVIGFSPESPEDVQEMVERIVGEVAGSTEKQAMAAIRKFAKANEIELPKAKGGKRGGGGSGGGIQKKVQDWMLENRDCNAEAITAQIQVLKPEITEGQLAKHVALATASLEFARKFAS